MVLIIREGVSGFLQAASFLDCVESRWDPGNIARSLLQLPNLCKVPNSLIFNFFSLTKGLIFFSSSLSKYIQSEMQRKQTISAGKSLSFYVELMNRIKSNLAWLEEINGPPMAEYGLTVLAWFLGKYICRSGTMEVWSRADFLQSSRTLFCFGGTFYRKTKLNLNNEKKKNHCSTICF